MSFNFQNLDSTTRSFMLQEVERDISAGTLYLSRRFNSEGLAAYPQLLREAVQNHNEVWLANELRRGNCFNSNETTQRGTKAVPVTAADTFADGEFNRFYMRGVCANAESQGIASVEIYRAKAVAQARSASQAIIGNSVSASGLLEGLRNSFETDNVLGLPAGPNSGLSVKLP